MKYVQSFPVDVDLPGSRVQALKSLLQCEREYVCGRLLDCERALTAEHRHAEGARKALIGAAVYGALATMAALGLWMAR